MKTLCAEALAKTVSERRIRLGWSQAELGEKINLAKPFIARIEQADYFPPSPTLQALADLLDFDITTLYIDKESSRSFTSTLHFDLNELKDEGIEKMFLMMSVIRQQILLRKKHAQTQRFRIENRLQLPH
ncbi:MAG: helix-turn-helix domain-containing protein [Sphaerochaeta sp.]